MLSSRTAVLTFSSFHSIKNKLFERKLFLVMQFMFYKEICDSLASVIKTTLVARIKIGSKNKSAKLDIMHTHII